MHFYSKLLIIKFKYLQLSSLNRKLHSLQPINQYIPKIINKNNWRLALCQLTPTQKIELETFLYNFENGIDIGLDNIPSPVKAKRNPPMRDIEKIKMIQTIIKWHNKGFLMGPFPANCDLTNQCRINPVFCVDKPDGSVRPVINYSKVINGESLNGLLNPEWCTVEYIQRKEIVYTIQSMGVGALIWAKDLENGYFNLKVKESLTKTIAFIFMGLLFIPMVLAFGLSSAPKIFTDFMWFVVTAIRFACDSMAWNNININVFQKRFFRNNSNIKIQGSWVYIPLIMYYLDDIFGVQRGHLAWLQFNIASKTLDFLGLSAKKSKDRPPSSKQIILGLEYDTILQQVSIPIDKVQRYTEFARSILNKKTVIKRTLFSLTGKVRYAALQCRALSAFARGVEIHGLKKHLNWHSHINVTNRLKRDLNLIIDALYHLNNFGISFSDILTPEEHFDFVAYTDASGRDGIGGFININNAPFFQVKWTEVSNYTKRDILWEELSALAVMIKLNIKLFRNKRINLWCDNKPITDMLIAWRAPLHRTDIHNVIREIARICIFNNITVWWNHIKGIRNKTADRLSRFKSNPFQFASVRPNSKPLAARKTLQYFVDLCL